MPIYTTDIMVLDSQKYPWGYKPFLFPSLDVGQGKDFETIQEAVDASENNTVIYIYPGIYDEGGLLVNKPVHLVGVGESPTDVKIIYPSNRNIVTYTVPNVLGRAELVIDNLWIECAVAWGRCLLMESMDYLSLTVSVYNCLLDASTTSAYPLSMDNSNVAVNCYNSTLLEGYAHIVNYDSGQVNFYKVEINGDISYQSSSKTIYNDDYVTTPTDGYGYEYVNYTHDRK